MASRERDTLSLEGYTEQHVFPRHSRLNLFPVGISASLSMSIGVQPGETLALAILLGRQLFTATTSHPPSEAPSLLVAQHEFATSTRPTEVISACAADFIRGHSLSDAVEEILAALEQSYRRLERVTIDLEEDPEVEGWQWVAVTMRVRGEIQDVLASEELARRRLREKLRREGYDRFVLSYEIPD